MVTSETGAWVVKLWNCLALKCLGVMHSSPTRLVVVRVNITVRLLGARAAPTNVVGRLRLPSVLIRLCTRETKGDTIKATFGSSVVGTRQYMDPFVLAGTMFKILCLVSKVLITFRRLGSNELQLKHCASVLSVVRRVATND